MPNRSIERPLLGRTQSLPGAREVEINAAVIATGLGIAPAQIQALMQAGKISTLCERGTGKDQGWYRATFHYAGRRFRILIDRSGRMFEET